LLKLLLLKLKIFYVIQCCNNNEICNHDSKLQINLFYFCGVHPVALLTRIPLKYIPSVTTDNFYLFYSVCSLHVSAPSGHLQVKHNIIICIFMKTIIPQHIRYFTVIHPYGVRFLSIYLLYNHIMIIVSLNVYNLYKLK
jgi:hypothetical protein